MTPTFSDREMLALVGSTPVTDPLPLPFFIFFLVGLLSVTDWDTGQSGLVVGARVKLQEPELRVKARVRNQESETEQGSRAGVGWSKAGNKETQEQSQLWV